MKTHQGLNSSDIRKALNTWQRREFSYGDADCCSFVAHVLTELTGKDYSALIVYKNKQEADILIAGHGSFEALIDSVLGEPSEIDDSIAVMVKTPIVGKMMGIKLEDSVVCVTKSGLIQIPKKYIIRGWSVCHKQ